MSAEELHSYNSGEPPEETTDESTEEIVDESQDAVDAHDVSTNVPSPYDGKVQVRGPDGKKYWVRKQNPIALSVRGVLR